MRRKLAELLGRLKGVLLEQLQRLWGGYWGRAEWTAGNEKHKIWVDFRSGKVLMASRAQEPSVYVKDLRRRAAKNEKAATAAGKAADALAVAEKAAGEIQSATARAANRGASESERATAVKAARSASAKAQESLREFAKDAGEAERALGSSCSLGTRHQEKQAGCWRKGTLCRGGDGEARAIEEQRLGRRVGTLPQAEHARAMAPRLEIDPALWREVFLVQDDVDNGGVVSMALLRPLEWVEQHCVELGAWVALDLPEMGVHGETLVTAVQPCPEIEEGEGGLVTGTFRRSKALLTELKVAGESDVLGVTGNHLVWSEDRQDRVIYLRGHGVRSIADKAKVTPETLFPIASCTKSFTTAAMALLVDEGKMQWDDPPRKHVHYFHLSDPLVDREVTLRDLVTHRTGLRDHLMLWYRSPLSAEERIRRFANLPLDQPFRTTFQYQSTMFTVAGLAAAKASGMSWADFVQKRLLDPLDMKTTYFTTTATAEIANKASPHRLDADKHPHLMESYPMERPEPAGSIQSNACDLAKWLRFQLNNRIVDGKPLISARRLEEMHTPQIVVPLDEIDRIQFPETNQMSYGLGWVIQDHFGHRILQHAGAIDGFRCHFTLVPKSRLGIVLMCNLHQTRMNIALSNSLLEMLLDLPHRDWNKIVAEADDKDAAESARKDCEKQKRRRANTRPSRELAGYTGAYGHPAYSTVRLTLENGRLIWQWQRWRAALEHYHYDTFTLPIEKMGHPFVVFTLDANGAVARMKVLGEIGVEFKRSP